MSKIKIQELSSNKSAMVTIEQSEATSVCGGFENTFYGKPPGSFVSTPGGGTAVVGGSGIATDIDGNAYFPTGSGLYT